MGPPPSSGAWREGDPIGERRFVELGGFQTVSGFRFSTLRVAYQRRLQEARGDALTPMGVAAIEAVTVAADRSLSLSNSDGRDLMRVLFEGMVNDQGVAL